MIVGIIQARQGSKRLPGKSMLPLAGKPLLYRFIERVKRSTMIEKVVLATTEKPEDDILVTVASQLGIETFRGAENDLVDRIYHAAKKYGADTIVRLSADNPLIESEEIDRIVAYHYLSTSDGGKLFSNTHCIEGNGYPDGLGAEVYSSGLLGYLWKYVEGSEYREHPHKWFYEAHNVTTIPCPDHLRGYSHVKLDVNTQEEYEFVKSIYDRFGHNNFHATDYLAEVS